MDIFSSSATVAPLTSQPEKVFAIAKSIGESQGYWPDEEITDACRQLTERAIQIPSMRLALQEVLLTRDVDSALEWLYEIGVIGVVLPELAATRELKQEPGRHHKDVWEHTKLVVKQAVKRPTVRWAALLHDIGKVPTRRFTNNGVTFYGHDIVGARMFDKIQKRLAFPEEERRTIRFLIKYHLRSAQYTNEWTDSAVRRFAADMKEHLVDLLDLSRADITSKRPGKRKEILYRIHELSQRIEEIRVRDEQVCVLPKGLGTEIIKSLNVPPAKVLGNLMEYLKTEVIQGQLEAGQPFQYYIDALAKSDYFQEQMAPHA